MTTPTLDEQIAMQKNRAEYWLGSGDREVQELAILASLESLREAMANDRRYRWLRQESPEVDSFWVRMAIGENCALDQLDIAIDSAIAKERG